MSTPLIIGVPSKGRLQENANAFFASAGLSVLQMGGGRAYAGTVAGVAGVEIAYLSAAEIARDLVAGRIHLGVTGEDLLRETLADGPVTVELLSPLGFGHANVAVAVPQSWIDVSTMADLDDVAAAFYASRRQRMRVATKYVNLTRAFFASHGIADYRIVESLGATEGAPGAGSAELIVDITTTGATLAANALKVLDDGVMLRSEANLAASLSAGWTKPVRRVLSEVLGRVAAWQRGLAVREVRFAGAAAARADIDKALAAAGAIALAVPGAGGATTAHCPAGRVYSLIADLKSAGVATISVSSLEHVFEAENPLYAKIAARLGWA
ncbi:MAG: ATP phosphoribosyltransferase [Hyphomicrobiales bacterium]|nr:ATP phosphoribosyltransferase [Hyphomicrobiales bacterium]